MSTEHHLYINCTELTVYALLFQLKWRQSHLLKVLWLRSAQGCWECKPHLSLWLQPGTQTQLSAGLWDLTLVQIPGQPPSSHSQVLGSWAQRAAPASAEGLALPVGSALHTAFPATPRTSMLLGNSALKKPLTEVNVRTHRSVQTLWHKLHIPL